MEEIWNSYLNKCNKCSEFKIKVDEFEIFIVVMDDDVGFVWKMI